MRMEKPVSGFIRGNRFDLNSYLTYLFEKVSSLPVQAEKQWGPEKWAKQKN